MQVVLAHDYLTQRGGAERVVLALCDAFPGAPLHVSCYEPSQTFPEFASKHIETSWLNRIGPLRRDPRFALPLLAPTMSAQHLDADVVVASSSGWAHAMRTSAPMVVYCHTPARWLYAPERYASTFSQRSHVAGTAATGIARLLGPPLRRWDAAAAARATTYVANSRAVRDAVRRAYGIEAELVPPPPALDPAGASQPIVGVEPGFVLTVSRLLPYKNVDLVLAAARERPTTHFVIVGDGPLRHEVEREAPHNVRLLHSVSDDELRWLYDHAAALLAPSFEDFGLTPLEAASMGTPTAALRAGGYLDTVDDGVTGSFFDALQVTDVLRALDDLACNPRSSSDLRAHAERFSRARFINSMQVIAAAAAR